MYILTHMKNILSVNSVKKDNEMGKAPVAEMVSSFPLIFSS